MNRPVFRPDRNPEGWAPSGARGYQRGALVSADALPFLRKVYGLFTLGVFSAVGGSLVALNVGEPVHVATREGTLAIPPIVAFGMQHGILMMLLYFGAFFGASLSRRIPGLNVAALFGYTFLTGLFLAPLLFVVQATSGGSLDPNPIRDAFLLTAAAFTGLSAYALLSRRDFSFLRGALFTGLWVLIGASLLGLFLHAAALQLAVASVGVLLFAGFILYDTARILRSGDQSDPVGAALSLFLDVVNMFLNLLRILSSARER